MGIGAEMMDDFAFERDYPFGIPSLINPVWVARDGRRIPLDEMTEAHILNCMRIVGEDCQWHWAFQKEIERRKQSGRKNR